MKEQKTFIYSLFTGLVLLTLSLAQGQAQTREQRMITTDQNKQLILRFFEEVFNQQSLSVIDEIYAPNVVDHTAFPDQAPGAKGIQMAIEDFFGFFDNLNITVEEVIAEDDKVVTLETWRGVHKPSGKAAEGSVVHIFRIRDGKITDEWSKGWDWLENL